MAKLVLVCAALAACGVDPIEVPDTIEVKLACDDFYCGNAKLLGAHPWWELDASMASYSPAGGLKIIDFRTAGNVVLKPLVQGYRLFGVAAGNVYYGGAGLVGSHLWLDSDLGDHFVLTLDSVATVPFPEGGADGTVIPTYSWSFVQYGGITTTPPAPVCSEGRFDSIAKQAVLFTGDRYDAATAKVKATGNTQPWFNFACKDDVLWKQFMFRYATVTQSGSAFSTGPTARNVSIASIHADYCGTNHPYTETGTDVDWANRGGWVWNDSGYTNVEAIWGGDGRAICLTHPRKVAKTAVGCRLDDCTPTQIANWAALGYEMITYVP